MAEMLIQSESLTSIADKIRVLSGTTNAMGLDEMANTVHTENVNFESNLSTQDSLIAQIQTALEGKASGGSGSGISGAVETGALTITDNGMYEPGVNEYFLSSDLLQSSKRTHIILTCQVNQRIHYVLIMITRETVSDSFTVWLGNLQNSHYAIASGQIQINENSIRVQGTIDTTTPITFLAW